MIKVIVSVLILAALQGCTSSDSSGGNTNDAVDLFPNILVDAQCFSSSTQGTDSWYKTTLVFDEDGYRNFGKAYYIDDACKNISYIEDGWFSTYPYRIGDIVKNKDGSFGTELLFPDPEGVGKYGSVVIQKDGEICFAKGTLEIHQSSLRFQPVDIDGDFTNLEIDYTSCMRIYDEE